MKIALIGYGKMGKAIQAAAAELGHEVVAIIDPTGTGTASSISEGSLAGAQVAIDFTTPSAVLPNLTELARAKVNVVLGTTGWYEHLPQVTQLVRDSGIGLVYAGNFSIGVQIFYAVAAEAARRLSQAGGFDVGVTEIHHTAKVDAPSGTAHELAQQILANFPSKRRITLDNCEQPVPAEALQISSSRIGQVVGVHSAIFDSAADTIEVTHRGKNRTGYATGAVRAAEWIAGKSGIFTAREWLGL